jgi:hypothetical protein
MLRSGPVSRVLSWATISLGRRLPAASSSRPEGDYGPNRPARPLARPHPLCLALLPVGFTLPFRSPGTRCALTAPFHPYRLTEANRRFVFCGTVPVLADGGRYPPRRPVEPGLSSPHLRTRRSPGPLRSDAHHTANGRRLITTKAQKTPRNPKSTGLHSEGTRQREPSRRSDRLVDHQVTNSTKERQVKRGKQAGRHPLVQTARPASRPLDLPFLGAFVPWW